MHPSTLDTTRPHLSRVVMLYRPESFDAALAHFSAALGLDFEDRVVPAMGLRVAVALGAGVELLTPHGEDGYSGFLHETLAAQGEGLHGFVFNVADVEASAAHAAAAGFDSQGARLDVFDAWPGWARAYEHMTEATLPPIAGVAVTLMEAAPRAPSPHNPQT